jgi:hypothetical protein
MAIFHGPDWRMPPTDPTIAASIYPQVVALTRLLITPHWQALTKSSPGRDRFLQELRSTVAAGYTWPDKIQSPDPLHRWLYQHWLVKPDPFLFSYHSWPMPVRSTDSYRLAHTRAQQAAAPS